MGIFLPDGTLNVSRETSERLEAYLVLLKKWNKAINLVSKATIEDAWARHFLDSAQLMDIFQNGAGHWVDIGSGGGFPGMVVAILAMEHAPNLTFTLVESDARKCAFLSTVARETGAPVRVISERIEDVETIGADIVSARALASLKDLLGYADRHLVQGGVAYFLKGENWSAEVADALEEWTFQSQEYPSATHGDAVVLELKEISRV